MTYHAYLSRGARERQACEQAALTGEEWGLIPVPEGSLRLVYGEWLPRPMSECTEGEWLTAVVVFEPHEWGERGQ